MWAVEVVGGVVSGGQTCEVGMVYGSLCSEGYEAVVLVWVIDDTFVIVVMTCWYFEAVCDESSACKSMYVFSAFSEHARTTSWLYDPFYIPQLYGLGVGDDSAFVAYAEAVFV